MRDYLNDMASTNGQNGGAGGGDTNASRRPPEWADGLKQLYDSVVEEALPDTFKDLLDRLDTLPPTRGKGGGESGSHGGPGPRG